VQGGHSLRSFLTISQVSSSMLWSLSQPPAMDRCTPAAKACVLLMAKRRASWAFVGHSCMMFAVPCACFACYFDSSRSVLTACHYAPETIAASLLLCIGHSSWTMALAHHEIFRIKPTCRSVCQVDLLQEQDCLCHSSTSLLPVRNASLCKTQHVLRITSTYAARIYHTALTA